MHCHWNSLISIFCSSHKFLYSVMLDEFSRWLSFITWQKSSLCWLPQQRQTILNSKKASDWPYLLWNFIICQHIHTKNSQENSHCDQHSLPVLFGFDFHYISIRSKFINFSHQIWLISQFRSTLCSDISSAHSYNLVMLWQGSADGTITHF